MGAAAKILVAGIGNIFLGDDAFGSEAARRLAGRTWPGSVRVVDFGIRGLDLAYALLDGYDLTILIDAVPRGGPPGTVYVIQPDLAGLDEAARGSPAYDAHTMDPVKVLQLAISMGAQFKELLLVGCEPADLGGEEGRMGLSPAVEGAMAEALTTVEALVAEYLSTASATWSQSFATTVNAPSDSDGLHV